MYSRLKTLIVLAIVFTFLHFFGMLRSLNLYEHNMVGQVVHSLAVMASIPTALVITISALIGNVAFNVLIAISIISVTFYLIWSN